MQVRLQRGADAAGVSSEFVFMMVDDGKERRCPVFGCTGTHMVGRGRLEAYVGAGILAVTRARVRCASVGEDAIVQLIIRGDVVAYNGDGGE